MTRLYIAMEDSLILLTRQGERWQLEVKLDHLPTYCIAIDPHRPERVYCSTFGKGLWKSDDAGDTWGPVGAGIIYNEVMSVAVSPTEQAGGYGVVWAGTEPSAVFRSEDGGETWQQRPGLMALPSRPTWSFPPRPWTHHVRWIEPDPYKAGCLYVAIEQGGIMRTLDGGQTWEDRKPGAQIDGHTLATHKRAPGRVYEAAGGSGLILEHDEQGRAYPILTEGGYAETRDGGITWETQVTGLEPLHYSWGIAIDPGDPETIIMSEARGPQQAHFPDFFESYLYRRTAGTAWQRVNTGLPDPKGTGIYVLASLETEPGVFYAATNRGVYQSTDTGITWQPLAIPWPIDRYRRQRVFSCVAGAYANGKHVQPRPDFAHTESKPHLSGAGAFPLEEQKTMRAVQIQAFGGYDQLQLVEIPRPEPAAGQVLVQMTAAAINPLDNLIRSGHAPMPVRLPLIPGNEGAGVLVAGEADFPIGTPVMFKAAYNLPHGGTWQEYVVARPGDLLPILAGKSDLEAAALRTGYQTAQMALSVLGGFRAGQVVLAPAVGGSVGNAVIQLARAQGAARVITTAGSTAKAQMARDAGYSDVIDLSQESLREGVTRLTENSGVDLVIDTVGGPLTKQALSVLKRGGTFVLVGTSGGEEVTLNLEHDVLRKNARILSLVLQSWPLDVREQALDVVLRLWERGQIKPLVARAFPLEQAAEAQRHLVEDRPFGKVILTFA